MPFNQLVLPLLGGYVFVNYTYLARYWASRHSKEHLIFLSAIFGAVFLGISRTACYLISRSDWGQHLSATIHSIAPFDGIGSATGSVLLGVLFWLWFNKAWSKRRAPMWLHAAGGFNSMEELLLKSAGVDQINGFDYLKAHPWRGLILGLIGWWKIRRLYEKFAGGPNKDEEPIEPVPIMLCMKDRKVYVGYVLVAIPQRADVKPYITVLPAWSGYRDKDTLRVTATEPYFRVIELMSTDKGANEFAKVICIEGIETASLYDKDAFEKFQTNGSELI